MTFDLPTLMFTAIFVTALTGSLLLFAWWQARCTVSLAWWGGGLLLGSGAQVLFAGRGTISGALSIGFANALILLAIGLVWTGLRVFEGRRVLPSAVAACPVIWIAACGVPDFYRSVDARIVLVSCLSGSLFVACAVELLRGRDEHLLSRYPLAGLFAVHALVMLARIPLTLAGGSTESTVTSAPWVISHGLEALLFTVAMAFLLMSLTKERLERQQRLQAMRDPLTGLLNRRAFLQDGTALLARPGQAGPDALVLFDIDQLRALNSAMGQAVGDDALRAFSGIVRRRMPPGAILSRQGGEEFAALVPDTTSRDALAWADAVRDEVGLTRFASPRGTYRLSVTVGIASGEGRWTIEDLLAAADLALVAAKTHRTGIEQRPVGHAA